MCKVANALFQNLGTHCGIWDLEGLGEVLWIGKKYFTAQNCLDCVSPDAGKKESKDIS